MKSVLGAPQRNRIGFLVPLINPGQGRRWRRNTCVREVLDPWGGSLSVSMQNLYYSGNYDVLHDPVPFFPQNIMLSALLRDTEFVDSVNIYLFICLFILFTCFLIYLILLCKATYKWALTSNNGSPWMVPPLLLLSLCYLLHPETLLKIGPGELPQGNKSSAGKPGGRSVTLRRLLKWSRVCFCEESLHMDVWYSIKCWKGQV